MEFIKQIYFLLGRINVNLKIVLKKIFDIAVKVLIQGLIVTIIICVMIENGWISKENDIMNITYGEFWNAYTSVTALIIAVHVIFSCISIISDDKKEITAPEQKKDEFISESEQKLLEIRAVHEAGHVVMGNALNVKVKEKTIKRGKHDIGYVSYEIGGSLIPEDIKKVVLLNYAGLIAERLLLGVASSGCMGSDNADLEQASICLKRYILLTDTEISLAGGECERVELHKKMKKLSKEFEQIAVNILKQRIPEIEREKEKLLNDYYKDLEKNK